MELTECAGTDPIVFLEGASEVLSAVVTGLKGNIRDGERAAFQEEYGVLQALLVDIVRDRTIHISGEKGLQVRLIDTGVLRKPGNPDLIR